jgi:hypothetical protein
MDSGSAPEDVLDSSALAPESNASQRRVLAAYKQILLSSFVVTLVVIATLGALLKFSPAPSLMSVVVLAGVLGAFFSALIRLYNLQDISKALVARELEELPWLHLLIYSMVPAVVGAIAATAIHMLFASGLLQGDLFPKFSCKDKITCDSFGSLIGDWGPSDAREYAKDIVWGFVAGFAERLVPDTLQSLSRSAREKDSQAPAPGS